jgi:hypothetical protein
MKCLLIETKDKKRFITHEKYLHQLVEFSKTFGATISVIEAEDVTPLKIEDLVPAICDQNYKNQRFKYEVLETKLKKETRDRQKMLRAASKIQEFIYSKFLKKETVSLKELKKRFKRQELSDAALCNHVRRVKEALEKEGFTIQKVGGGMYRIQ